MIKKRKLNLKVLKDLIIPKDLLSDFISYIDNDEGNFKLNELIEYAIDNECIGTIDWRSEESLIVYEINKLLKKLNINSFDWSFHDLLEDLNNSEVFKTNNFLSLIRDQIKSIHFNLTHLHLYDDNYYFIVLNDSDFKKVNGMNDEDNIKISDDFLPDEHYKIGMNHLNKVGFSQKKTLVDKKGLDKKRARKIKTLRKQLEDESTWGEDEDLNSLVPPYAQLTTNTSFGIKIVGLGGKPKYKKQESAYSVARDIDLYTSWLQRRASLKILNGENQYGSSLVLSWKLILLRQKFIEISYLNYISGENVNPDALEDISLSDISNFWNFTIACLGFYFFGFKDYWNESKKYFRLFKRRQNFVASSSYSEELNIMQFALIEFLMNDERNESSFSNLAQTSPFQPLNESWENDSDFSTSLDILCDKHLDDAHAARLGGPFHVSAYSLFPIWILVIDQYREMVLGRSALPKNKLMEISAIYTSANYDDIEDSMLNTLEELYLNEHGSEQPDLYQIWVHFLDLNNS